MASMITSWYTSQYSVWNHTRRMHAPSFLPRTDTVASRNAANLRAGGNGNGTTTANANDVVINMGDLSPERKDNKDTLFGPSIGLVGTAPAWCSDLDDEKHVERGEKDESEDEDELTPEVVKEWVKRSTESTEPTTTLQALVNLKRPTIRLSPLAHPVPSDPQGQAHHPVQQHGLEFEFDCDAPHCAISLHVIGVPAHLGVGEDHDPHDPAHAHLYKYSQSREVLALVGDAGEHDRLHLFEATVEGGFARKLTLSAGATLELAQLETAARAHQRARDVATSTGAAANLSASDTNAGADAGMRDRERETRVAAAEAHARKRLTFFRKKGNAHNAAGTGTGAPVVAATAGPALAVVDAEAAVHQDQAQAESAASAAAAATTSDTSSTGAGAGAGASRSEEDEEGVKVAIRLSARDIDGRPLCVRNEQVTYLHVVRHGLAPGHGHGQGHSASNVNLNLTSVPRLEGDSSNSNSNTNAADGAGVGAEHAEMEAEDTRPWVVKVVKREARIGPHAFHLHEIYGLTAHSAATATAAAAASSAPSPTSLPTSLPPPADAPPSTDTPVVHTYPPAAPAPTTTSAPANAVEEADATAECLLCLSAPREVVLLPCRHLVACRECAVNMVEFGAGGNVVHSEGEAAGAGAANGTANVMNVEGNANANGEGADGEASAPAPTPAPAPVPPPMTRRKRKAKGWFCPVCRQPYASLLRITTAPPPSAKGDAHGHSLGSTGVADSKRISLASSLEPEQEQENGHDGHGLEHEHDLEHPLADVPALAHENGGRDAERLV